MKRGVKLKENISELVWLYIKRRPFVRDMLKQRIVNYSSLARKISLEIFGSKKHFNAIKVALQRLSDKISDEDSGLEEKVRSVLKKSTIMVRNKVAVVVSVADLPIKPISYAKSANTITYIVSENELKSLKYSKSIQHIEENANLMTISSPPDIESTPGVIAMILNALSSEGVNVLEFISCYTDTLLVIKQADTTRAYEILCSIME